ncbi:MAG: alpha-amylase family glycosyl hydrolase [Leptospiraceae bacterium]|nr:alpha-amylase family glycosyl hydrolase [Leptospiraceae bacterium]MDW8307571.1 alpha-amylase family glycosyl hydrolase [Leptospiraceae bacterium]
MGPKIVDGGVNFTLYSERATRVHLLIFDDPESKYPLQEYQMSRFGNVWSIFVQGVGHKTYYGYRVWGPNFDYDPAWRPGTMYGFISDYDNQGNRFNPNKLLLDPYARAVHRKHDWSRGMAASGPHRHQDTTAAAAKGIVLREDDYEWSQTEKDYWHRKQCVQIGQVVDGKPCTATRRPRNSIIVYEVHPKGLSAGAVPNIPGLPRNYQVKYPGTFRGAGELAPYLAELGVTAVEFLPVHEAGSDGGYWKYWTLNFFAPEVTYAYKPKEGSQVNEFRWMVEQFHKYDIEVWIDVVYNHTGEGGLWRERIPNVEGNNPTNPYNPHHFWGYDPPETATILSYRGIDNYAYYALTGPNKEFYYDHTGTGNMLRTGYPPVRRMVLDSLKYWVEKMHVDGFRFDLCEVLEKRDGQETGNWNAYDYWKHWGPDSDSAAVANRRNMSATMHIVNDPLFQRYDIRMVAEPWSLGGYRYGDHPKAYCYGPDGLNYTGYEPGCANQDTTYSTGYAYFEWSDLFKRVTRRIVNHDDYRLNSDSPVDFGGALTGSAAKFAESWDGRQPYHNINKITAHDGFTMYDLLSYNQKRNGRGPLNPDGVDPYSGDDYSNYSRDWGWNEGLKRQNFRNLIVLLLLSIGTPMLLGGDEWMRTQYGNNNAYTAGADNQYNWFRWGVWLADPVAYRMYDFTKKIIAFRKDNLWAFGKTSYHNMQLYWNDIVSPSCNSNTAGALAWGGTDKVIALCYANPPAGKKLIYIVFNLGTTHKNAQLPPGNWRVLVDTQEYFEGFNGQLSGNWCPNYNEPGFNPSSPKCLNTVTGNYGVPPRTIVIFQAE